MLLGFGVSPQNWISQDKISLVLLEQIVNFLKFGKIYYVTKGDVASIRFNGIKSANRFINLFENKKFHGDKGLNYKDFCNIVDLMNKKEHLNKKGFAKIKIIKSGMNTKRES